MTGNRMVLLGVLAVGLAAAGDVAATGRDDADEPRLAGLMECTPRIEARWPWSGAWVFPVGDSLHLGRPVGRVRGYYISRGVIRHSATHTGHDGADLVNGRRGGRVRAAATGVVVSVKRSVGGYGAHVVIAHHLEDGSLVYTVYAHLATGSVRIHKGAVVGAGEPIARVGQTGRATTPHLHFEVRVPEDSTLRWENCPVTDPVAFVRDRLATERPDSVWAAPYLAWAEFASLVPCGLDADTPVDAALLARVLERAGAGDEEAVTVVDSDKASHGDHQAPGWNTIARALGAMSTSPGRLRPCPVGLRRYARTCQKHLGVRRPARELHRLAERDQPPTVADLCLALADFAPRPVQHRRAPIPDRLTAVP